MRLADEPNNFHLYQKTDLSIGVRKLLRDTFSQSVERGDYPTAWSLRPGFVELLQRDTLVVLGYKADKVETFMGLPIEICAADTANRLITSTGNMAVAELGVLRRVR